jgi:signal transduction histidine kinase
MSRVPPQRPGPSWLFSQLVYGPAHSRGISFAVIAATLLTIGWFDYLTGRQVSLGLFYFLPIALGVAWLGPRSACVVATLSVLTRIGADRALGSSPSLLVASWNRVTDYAIYLVLVWVLHHLLSLSRELERRVVERTQALEAANRERQRLERELLDIASRERNAVGRELHEDLGQQLFGTALAAKVLAEHLATKDPAAARDAQAIVGYLEDSIAKTRDVARSLLLGAIEPAELPHELAALAATNDTRGVPCRFILEGHPFVGDPATAAQLFRIAQEALRNARRHAHAKRVDLVLAGNETATFLMITDDGRGLPPPESRGFGLGLQIMKHRAAVIGGILSVIPAPGEGTRVICHLPHTGAA